MLRGCMHRRYVFKYVAKTPLNLKPRRRRFNFEFLTQFVLCSFVATAETMQSGARQYLHPILGKSSKASVELCDAQKYRQESKLTTRCVVLRCIVRCVRDTQNARIPWGKIH